MVQSDSSGSTNLKPTNKSTNLVVPMTIGGLAAISNHSLAVTEIPGTTATSGEKSAKLVGPMAFGGKHVGDLEDPKGENIGTSIVKSASTSGKKSTNPVAHMTIGGPYFAQPVVFRQKSDTAITPILDATNQSINSVVPMTIGGLADVSNYGIVGSEILTTSGTTGKNSSNTVTHVTISGGKPVGPLEEQKVENTTGTHVVASVSTTSGIKSANSVAYMTVGGRDDSKLVLGHKGDTAAGSVNLEATNQSINSVVPMTIGGLAAISNHGMVGGEIVTKAGTCGKKGTLEVQMGENVGTPNLKTSNYQSINLVVPMTIDGLSAISKHGMVGSEIPHTTNSKTMIETTTNFRPLIAKFCD